MTINDSLKLYRWFNLALSFDLYAGLKVIVFYYLTASYSAAAGLLAISLVSAALAEVPTGILSDRTGRKLTIVLGVGCFLIAYGLFAAGSAYPVFALAAGLEGIGAAAFSGNNNAYLHNLLEAGGRQDEFHHHYGQVMAIKTFAEVAGMVAGGWLATWSIGLALWLNLLPKTAAFGLALVLQPTGRSERPATGRFGHLSQAVQEIKRNLTLRYISLSTMTAGGGLAAGELQAAAFALVWPTWAVGLARGVQVGAIVPGYYYAGKLIDKFGSVPIIAAGTILSVLGNLGTGLVRTVISPLFVMLSLPLYGPADAASQRILQKEFTEHQRATIASLNSLGNSLSGAAALFVCGLVADRHGPFVALLFTQVLLLPSLFYQYLFLKRVHREYEHI